MFKLADLRREGEDAENRPGNIDPETGAFVNGTPYVRDLIGEINRRRVNGADEELDYKYEVRARHRRMERLIDALRREDGMTDRMMPYWNRGRAFSERWLRRRRTCRTNGETVGSIADHIRFVCDAEGLTLIQASRKLGVPYAVVYAAVIGVFHPDATQAMREADFFKEPLDNDGANG